VLKVSKFPLGSRLVVLLDPDQLEMVHEKFQRSPRKSIRLACRDLRIELSSVHGVVQKLRASDRPSHAENVIEVR
jgi:hypothetical protein